MFNKLHIRFSLTVLATSFAVGTPAAGQTRHEIIKLVAEDASEGDHLGVSVGLYGTTAVVGASSDDHVAEDSGSAYLFDVTTGQHLFKLTASDAGHHHHFGSSVAISGLTAIIGAHSFESVYLFDTTTGQQLFKLNASDFAWGDWFGVSVAISGNTAIVGASKHDADGVGSGSAYLFDITTGQELFKLKASDAADDDKFGRSVAISGTTAIVGAYGNSSTGNKSGAAYIFDTVNGQQLFKLSASDSAEDDWFGFSVGISGTTAIVGAMNNDNPAEDSGSAYLFNTTTGKEVLKLSSPDSSRFDRFGRSVAISDTVAVVGAYLTGTADSGSAYLFDTTTGQMIFQAISSEAASGDWTGTSVAISGSYSIVGSFRDDDDGFQSGSALLFGNCIADLSRDGILNFYDVSAFLLAFVQKESAADFYFDGQFNFFDLYAFLTAYQTGCP